MRIRLPFAGAFLFLTATAAYAGLTSLQLETYINDKLLHFLTFFLLTTTFYWILDTSRRRSLHLTLLVCTLGLGIGSEFLQHFLPNGRSFDVWDIGANVVGSLGAVGLCSWYHVRMLERKRRAKGYQAVVGEDVELGEGVGVGEGVGAQESGEVTGQSLDQEVDNWDENEVDDWDAEEHTGTEDENGPKTPSASSAGEAEDAKKRAE